MRASNKAFKQYLDKVLENFPRNFETELTEEGCATGITAYVYISYMRDGNAKACAEVILDKFGVDDEDDGVINWEGEGGAI